MGTLFFLAIYVVFALPIIAALWTLAWLLRKRHVPRTKSIAIFTITATLALTPYATQMATLYVGIVPMGYFIFAMPFEAKGAAVFFFRVYYDFLTIHLVGMTLTGIVSFYVAHKLFPNIAFERDAAKARRPSTLR